MSLNPTALLKPREVIETYSADFETVLNNMDVDKIFDKVIRMAVHKRILLNAIFSKDPVNLIFVGPPGTGKSLLLECIADAFPLISNKSDAQTSSGIGVIESVLFKGKMLRFLIVDELEKFDKNDLDVFLGLIANGSINRELANRTIKETGYKVWFFATSNDLRKLRRKSAPLVNRCTVINVPELEYEDYLYVASKRLLREEGIENEEIGKFIASRVYSDFGAKDIRLAVRLARFAYGHAARTKQYKITKDIIEVVANDFKLTEVKL